MNRKLKNNLLLTFTQNRLNALRPVYHLAEIKDRSDFALIYGEKRFTDFILHCFISKSVKLPKLTHFITFSGLLFSDIIKLIQIMFPSLNS